ncbi:hypothetical protein FGO68_gene10246 [Halteria grandinella]|uniref:Uncharacterized protein n=1 Tax=Halteria grandinella TaxID=5974 RepID=A0A8J8NQ40_HALGN|nr:hypothetical protein FGO68_gene10246 [Halteria grandinella]
MSNKSVQQRQPSQLLFMQGKNRSYRSYTHILYHLQLQFKERPKCESVITLFHAVADHMFLPSQNLGDYSKGQISDQKYEQESDYTTQERRVVLLVLEEEPSFVFAQSQKVYIIPKLLGP